MQEAQKILEQIGLNHHESSIYLHLLEKGEAPASRIANTLSLPRSTVRGTLDKLCERQLATKMYKRNTQYYQCKAPDALIAYINNEIEHKKTTKKNITAALPMLEAMHLQRNIVPKVTFYEGKEGVIEAFNHSLYAEEKEILFFTSYEFLQSPVIRKNDDDFYMPLRIRKKISMRVLVGKTEETSKLIAKAPYEFRERRFIPEKYRLPGNIHIYGDYVVYFSASNNEYMAVTVQSSMIAETMRTLFEFMWETV